MTHVHKGALLSTVFALLFTLEVSATGSHSSTPSNPQSNSNAYSGSASDASAGAWSGAAAVSGSQSDATGGSASATGGKSNSYSDASADGTQTTVVDASSSYAAQVPALIMGTVIPVDCGFGGQAGGANTHGAGFLGASWTTDRCYTLKVANAWAAMGEYEYACEMLMDVSRRAIKRRGITSVDCVATGARLRAQHVRPTVVTRQELPLEYVTPTQMREYVDRAFRHTVSK